MDRANRDCCSYRALIQGKIFLQVVRDGLAKFRFRGRMPEWYHKNFGHVNAILVANIQSSFQQNAVGPESKV